MQMYEVGYQGRYRLEREIQFSVQPFQEQMERGL